MSDKVFANGLFVQDRRPNTPDFVLGKFSIKVDEFIQCLQQYRNQAGYVNISMIRGRDGKKPYFEVDTYGLQQQNSQQSYPPQSAGPQTQPAYQPAPQDDDLRF